MVSVITSSEICGWFEPQSGKAKDQAHENEMDLSSREKFCSKILFTVSARGFMHNQWLQRY
jgi:hypothetical protein